MNTLGSDGGPHNHSFVFKRLIEQGSTEAVPFRTDYRNPRDPHNATLLAGNRQKGAKRMSGDRGTHYAVVVVHGVGETEPGLALNTLCDTLGQHGVEVDAHSELHRFSASIPNSDRTDSFPAFARRARFANGNTAKFSELYWADLTRVAPGRFNAFAAIFRIVFEAHHLVDAMLAGKQGLPIGVLRWVAVAMAMIIRGPIAGLNICIFVVGLASLFLIDNQAVATWWQTPEALVLGPLALVLCSSVAVFAWSIRRRDAEWADVFGWTALASAIAGTAFLVVDKKIFAALIPVEKGHEHVRIVAGMLDAIYKALDGLWIVWGGLFMASVAIVLLLVVTTPWWRDTERRLARAAAAVGLTVLQAVLWVLLIAALALPLLDRASLLKLPYGDVERIKWVFAATVVGVLIVFLVGLATHVVRYALARQKLFSANAAARSMPRLLFGAGLLVVLIGSTIINLIGTLALTGRLTLPPQLQSILQALQGMAVEHGKILGVGIAVAGVITGWLISSSSSVGIHIARDLIDHQYSPRLGLLHLFTNSLFASDVDKPRRARIQRRLNAVMVGLVLKERFDKLLFVVHSQGSVIMFDCLAKHSPSDIGKIGVVSFGSPLSYLYQRYFLEYEDLERTVQRLRPMPLSWINLHRIDDYIGTEINGGTLIVNERMGPGGHTNYWIEPRLCKEITGTIVGDRPPTAVTVAAETPGQLCRAIGRDRPKGRRCQSLAKH